MHHTTNTNTHKYFFNSGNNLRIIQVNIMPADALVTKSPGHQQTWYWTMIFYPNTACSGLTHHPITLHWLIWYHKRARNTLTHHQLMLQWLTWFHSTASRELTFVVLKPVYSRISSSTPWLLMSWPFLSPGHQQTSYWLYIIQRFFAFIRQDFSYLDHLSVVKL